MEIRLRLPSKKKVRQLSDLLLKKLKRSRFEIPPRNITVFEAGNRCRHGKLRIYAVRLKTGKYYHGAGPVPQKPMERRGWGKGSYKPHKLCFLEGADWIEFNDLLNDFCDELGLCADIFSRVCSIRRGWFRRVIYRSIVEKGIVLWERFPPPEHFMGVTSTNGPFPMSSFFSAGAGSTSLAPAGIYRNVYLRWSRPLEDMFVNELLTSLIERGKISAN